MSRVAIVAGLAALGLAAGAAIGVARMRSSEAPPASTASPTTPSSAPAASGVVVTVADAKQLEHLLAEHRGTALIDFHAEWCKPCKELSPRVEALAKSRPELLVMSVDVVASEALGTAWRAEDLPLLVRLEDGREVARQVGAPSSAELERWLDQPLKP
jgi:thioredoxin-like negative regulator of GroEL